MCLHGLEVIWRDGEVVGYIRTAEYAFAIDKSMAYGYITHPQGEAVTLDYLRAGTYQIEHIGKQYSANLHLRSPFDPKNKRVKGIYDEPLPIRK